MATHRPLIDNAGTLSEMPSGDAVAVAAGGTGLAAYTTGDLIYADGASSLAKLAGVATGNVLLSGGVATAPSWGKVTSSHVDGTIALTSQLVTDHGALTGLSDDDHTQYALLVGRSGGQTLVGGTASGNNLVLKSNSSQDGLVLIQSTSGNSLKVEMSSSTSASHIGVYSTVSASSSGNASLIGIKNAISYSGGGGTVTSGIGIETTATLSSTTTTFYGLYNSLLVDGGTTTTAYGCYVALATLGGTITTGYGIYIADVTASTAYAIYDNSGGKKSSFSGQIESRLAGGTAPFVVTSTTLVSNLNADLLDGSHASAFALASHAHSAADITSGTLPITRGGTGATSLTSGYVPYSSGGTAYAASPIYTNGTNVGVGTAAPVRAFEIFGSSNVSSSMALSRSGFQKWIIQPSSTSSNNLAISQADSDGVTNYLERLVVTSTGNVGIGTSSPSGKLNVLSTSGEQLRLTHTASTKYAAFTLDTNGYLTLLTTGERLYCSGDTLSHPMTAWAPAAVYFSISAYNNSNGGGSFNAYTDGTAGVPGLKFGGYVGTTSPSSSTPSMLFDGGKYDGGTSVGALANTEVLLGIENRGTRRITVLGSGYAGFGVTSPTAFLHPAASTTSAASLRIPSGTAPTSPNSGDFWYDGTNLKFRDGGTTRTVTWT